MGAPVGGTTVPDERKALEEALKTPITEDEAREAYADIDVERCKLSIIRQKWVAQMQQMQLQINDLDARLIALDLDRAVIFRRSLIPVETAPDGNAT